MSALEQLRESLREAARRDIDLYPARPRRRRRRATGLVAIALLGGAAAAATAGELLSVGEPVTGPAPQNGIYDPTGEPDLAVKANGYGAEIFTLKDGRHCVRAGNVNGNTLGRIEGETFRPYGPGQPAACGRPGRSFASSLQRDGRVIVVGLSPKQRVRIDGAPIPTHRGGVFLAVFEGSDQPKVEYENGQ